MSLGPTSNCSTLGNSFSRSILFGVSVTLNGVGNSYSNEKTPGSVLRTNGTLRHKEENKRGKLLCHYFFFTFFDSESSPDEVIGTANFLFLFLGNSFIFHEKCGNCTTQLLVFFRKLVESTAACQRN